MVHHGFGGTVTGSSKPVSDKVAIEISMRDETIFAHVVREKHNRPPPFDVFWEFDPDRLPRGMKPEDLIEEINRIEGVHPEKTHIWIIQKTYQKGTRVKKPKHIPGEPVPGS